MLAKRIIPCLDVDAGRVVKGTRFVRLRDAGDPVEVAVRYNAEGADEIVFLDITASVQRRKTMIEVVRRTAARVFMPLTVGGGVQGIEDIRNLLKAGADKVSLNTAAVQRPSLVREATQHFGTQCIVVAIDAKRVVPQGGSSIRLALDGHSKLSCARLRPPSGHPSLRTSHWEGPLDPPLPPNPHPAGGGRRAGLRSASFYVAAQAHSAIPPAGPLRWEVYTHGGRRPTGLDVVAWAKRATALGAGEILLTSMDCDGTKEGYDLALLEAVTRAVSVPVIASGGAGTLAHFYQALTRGGADAALAASLFHFRELSIAAVKRYLARRGVTVRR